MEKTIDYKVENGKLIRINIDLDNTTIKNIKITGDFFIHPEESIILIENELKNKDINQIKETIEKIKEENNIKFVGFDVDDIVKAINSLS